MDSIVFGAGASFGSDSSGVPPISNNLMDALVRFSPNAWGKIPQEFVDLFRNDFENAMSQLSARNTSSHMMPPLQRAMAAYFFQFNPSPGNLYRKLAAKIHHSSWRGSLVTFNYERLLELSLIDESLTPVVRLSNNPKEIEVCRPHGCCHLFCESVRSISSAVSFSGTAVTTNGPIKVISDPSEFNKRIMTDAFPPVMSYFEPQKRTTSGLNFITSQRNRFRETILASDKIIIIGLKVRPHDQHIWAPLSETSAKIFYCSGEKGGSEFRDWANQNRTGKDNKVFYGYFEQYFSDICDEIRI